MVTRLCYDVYILSLNQQIRIDFHFQPPSNDRVPSVFSGILFYLPVPLLRVFHVTVSRCSTNYPNECYISKICLYLC